MKFSPAKSKHSSWLWIAIIASPVIIFFAKVELDIGSFYARTSEEKLISKTEAQVTQLLGAPDDQVTDANGSRDLIYIGPHSSCCRVELRRGVVTAVAHWQK